MEIDVHYLGSRDQDLAVKQLCSSGQTGVLHLLAENGVYIYLSITNYAN